MKKEYALLLLVIALDCIPYLIMLLFL